MIGAGMSVARLNLSHGTFEEHAERVQRIREAASIAGRRVAIMIDTRGIEIRTGLLKGSYVDLNRGMSFRLWTHDAPGDESGVSVSYPKLPSEVSAGDVILLDDGAVELEVLSTNAQEIDCRVIHGGILGKTKGVNLTDTELSMTAVGPENEVQFSAKSRVSNTKKIMHAIHCCDVLSQTKGRMENVKYIVLGHLFLEQQKSQVACLPFDLVVLTFRDI